MADTPEIKSKEQIYGLILDAILSRSNILSDLNPGSVLDSIILAFSEVGFKLTADQIMMIDSLALDRASGDALRRIANDEKVEIFSSSFGTGYITIIDTSITKIQDKVYPGLPAPVAGSNSIFIVDGTKFPQQGQIYIGRGTSSVEGPLTYTAITPIPALNPDYYEITLSTPTTKFHNLAESVVLAQGGNRTIPVGTVAQTAQGIASEAISFTTTVAVTILDGEVEISNVPIIAATAGPAGNVARGTIVEVLGLNFSASATNPSPITNAIPDDTNESLRDRIKLARASKAKGTETAIKFNAIGISSPTELKRVISANTKRSAGQEQALIVDDGNGYEPIDEGIGLEQVIDQALGNELELQLENPMVVKASVRTLNQGPFDVQGSQNLIIEIDGENVPVHTFQAADFRVFRAATAFEIVASINSSTQNLPYYARTLDGGTRVQLISKERNEIKVSSASTANLGLNFPTNKVYTARLYKNDKALFQDGLEASVLTADQPNWGTITAGDKLKYQVDGTSIVTIELTNQMFQKYGPTLTVHKSQPITIWANVLTDIMPGVSVTVVGQKLKYSSRSGKSSEASINITSDDPNFSVGAAFFPSSAVTSQATGLSSDYILNLKTGQLELDIPLQAGDQITAGSKFTRAKFETAQFSTSSISLGTNAKINMIVDGSAEFVALDMDLSQGIQITPSSSAIAWSNATTYEAGDFATDGGTTYQALYTNLNKQPTTNPALWEAVEAYDVNIRATGVNSSTPAFGNSKTGDWLVLWQDPTDAGANSFSAQNQGAYRVKRKTDSNNLLITNASAISETKIIIDISRMTSVRSERPVQFAEFEVSGMNSIDTIEKLRDAFASKFNGVLSSIVNGRVRVQSKTLDESISELFLVTLSENAKNIMGLATGAYTAVPSHNAFIAADVEDCLGSPTFKIFEIDQSAGITDNTFRNAQYELGGGTMNELVQFIAPKSGVSTILDSATNKKTAEQVREYNPTTDTLTFKPNPVLLTDVPVDNQLIPTKSKAQGDQYILRQGLMLDAEDTLSFIIDQDKETKAFLSKVARRISIVTATPPSIFSATDDESTLSLNHPSTFKDFDFKDFKFWIQARNTIQGVQFKYNDFGQSGTRNAISIRYPSEGSAELSHSYEQSRLTTAVIKLASGAARSLGTLDDYDQNSGFIVSAPTVSGNTETVLVSHTAGVGATPNFLGSGGPQIGDVAVIDQATGFRSQNKGSFKVTAVNATSFEIQAPVGTFVQDNLAVNNIVYPDEASAGLPYGQGTALAYTTQPHNVIQGQKIGIWGAAPTDYVGAFVVSEVVDAFRFRFTPTGIDGDSISTVARTVTVGAVSITITVPVSVGAIAAGSRVKVSDVALAANSFNGVYTASAGTLGTTLQIDFVAPAHVASTNFTVTNRERSGNIATLTIGAHALTVGSWVNVTGVSASYNGSQQISGVTGTTISFTNVGTDEASTASAGNVATAYATGSFVLAGGVVYKSINVASSTPPSADWTIIGNVTTTVVPGRIDQNPTTMGSLSRVLQADDNLRFFPVVSTRQDIADYVNSAMSDYYSATADAPTTNTLDANSQLFSGAQYIGAGSVTVTSKYGSRERLITLPSIVIWEQGAKITIQLAASGNALRSDIHNVELQVIKLDNSSGQAVLTVQVDRLADPSETSVTLAGTWVVTQDSVGLGESESYIKTYTQNTTPAASDFILKTPLADLVPGEEAYLIATTADQLARFTARLANSGLSNVAEVLSSESQNSFQVRTNVFGSDGAVTLSGGKANSIFAAITGSGAIRNNQAGFDVLSDFRKPFVPGSFAKLANTVVQNKDLGIDEFTQIQISPNTPSTGKTTIYSPDPIFRTTRTFDLSAQTKDFKLERHGKYMCLQQIAGSDSAWEANLTEGDWLIMRAPEQLDLTISGTISRTSNISKITVVGHTFAAEQTIQVSGVDNDSLSFNGTWIVNSISGNDVFFYNEGDDVASIAVSGVAPKVKRIDPVQGGNLGIFRVLRIFGNAVWFENELGFDQRIARPYAGTIQFFSYDSILPGDNVQIGGTVLLTENVGTHTVSDDIELMTANSIIVDASLNYAINAVGGVITAIQRSAGVVTLTTTSAHGLTIGSQVFLSGIGFGFDGGPFTAIGGTTGSTIVFNQSGANIVSFAPSSTAIVGSYITLGAQFQNFSVLEAAPLELLKQVTMTGPSSNNPEFAWIGVDSAPLITRISPTFAAYVQSLGKLGAEETTHTGLDAYRHYEGMLLETYLTMYGDATNPSRPGVVAFGADVDIQAPIRRGIKAAVQIRVKSGVPFGEIINSVKSVVAGYIDSRGVGEVVVISAMIAAIQKIEGILAVVEITTNPLDSSGIINVQSNEVSKVIDADADITVSIVNNS